MNFYGFDIPWLSAKSVLAVMFFLFLIFIAIVSVVMIYHWRKYGMNSKEIWLAEITYLTGLVVLGGGVFFELSFLK